MILDGQGVAYCGDPDGSLEVGDLGQVMQAGHTASHVKWASGNAKDSITLVANYELTVTDTLPRDADLLNSGLIGFNAQAVAATRGARGVLSALRREGHLGNLTAIADEAFRFVSARLREDPSFIEACSQLDQHDADELVARAAAAVLRDAVDQG